MRSVCLAVSLAAGGLVVPAMGQTDSFPMSDNFDSYPAGSFPCTGGNCVGPNGWSIWYSGGSPATIVSGNAQSGNNSMQLAAASDITQTGSVTTGRWTVRAYLYFPATETGQMYFIVMNSYNGSPGVDTWSIEIQFDGALGTVRDDINGVYPPPAANTGPVIGTMVRDQWAEVRAEIDLGTNRYDLFYNGTQVRNQVVYTPPTSPVATPGIRCLDLYSFNAGTTRYDTVSVQQATVGCYANCDGSTTPPVANVADFTCFLQKFAANDAYANCDGSTTPPTINVADFTCFLQKFAAGCP